VTEQLWCRKGNFCAADAILVSDNQHLAYDRSTSVFDNTTLVDKKAPLVPNRANLVPISQLLCLPRQFWSFVDGAIIMQIKSSFTIRRTNLVSEDTTLVPNKANLVHDAASLVPNKASCMHRHFFSLFFTVLAFSHVPFFPDEQSISG
jgi:hypothetical protein